MKKNATVAITNLIFMLTIALSTVGCSPDSDDSSNNFTKQPDSLEILTKAIKEAFNYPENLPLQIASQSEFVYDHRKMQLFYGLINDKIWLGIAEKIRDNYMSYYEWISPEAVEKSIIVNSYGEQKKYDFLYLTRAYGIEEGNNRLAFSINIFYGKDVLHGYGISKLIIDNNGNTQTINLDEKNQMFKIRNWTDNYFIIYDDQSIDFAGGCYAYTGEKIYNISDLVIDSNNPIKFYSLISLEEGIVIRQHLDNPKQPKCTRYNFRTGEIIWSNENIFPDMPTDARYDSWKIIEKNGIIWSFTAKVTLYSGEKITRNFQVNIETGNISHNM